MNPYTPDKALAHGDRLVVIKKGGVPAPVHLHLVISNTCNLSCDFCAYRRKGHYTNQVFDDGVMMATGKVYEIIGDAADMGIKAIQFTGGGEPTVHPSCADFLRAAADRGMKTALVTNGVCLRGDVAEAAMCCDWVRVSVDAASPATYSAIKACKESVHEKVLANIRTLVQDRGSSSHPYIGVSYVVTPGNWREIPRAVDMALALGVDNIRFAGAFTELGGRYYDGIEMEIVGLLDDAVGQSNDRLLVTGNIRERLKDLAGPPDDAFCPYQYLTTYVGADLNVYRCCCTAYNRRGILGSITNRSFVDLWTSEELALRLKTFDARGCPQCQFRTRNAAARQLINHLPTMHVDFV